MTDERDDLPPAMLEALRESYNPPPETPRDEMWAVIEARIAETDVTSIETRRARRLGGPGTWFGGLAAAAAFVMLGVGLGRMTAPTASVATGEPAALEMDRSAAIGELATRHLSETESLLRMVRVDSRRGSVDGEVGQWSRDLLTKTRLLLDSDADLSPEVRILLEDLELVLVQVTVVASGDLPAERRRGELELLDEDLETQNLLPRIEAAVPGPRIQYAGS